ncbi:MAG: hypothetical protein KJ724_13860, partial [Proteobacteria bacterium]|nr:hypothetical protein [Pseudomonadota bacterium]
MSGKGVKKGQSRRWCSSLFFDCPPLLEPLRVSLPFGQAHFVRRWIPFGHRRGYFLLLAQKKVTKEKGLASLAAALHGQESDQIALLPNQVAEA